MQTSAGTKELPGKSPAIDAKHNFYIKPEKTAVF